MLIPSGVVTFCECVLVFERDAFTEEVLVVHHGVELTFHEATFTQGKGVEQFIVYDELAKFFDTFTELLFLVEHAVEVGFFLFVHDIMI